VLGTGVEIGEDADGYVPFLDAGSEASGEFFCAECGYGVSVQATLPVCPMCGGTAWEQTVSSPLARAALHVL
jgi:rubrerythrin